MSKQVSETNAGVCSVLSETLQIQDPSLLTMDSELLGVLPEFDSMAVVGVLTGLEECFDFEIEDDEISADLFETVGTLVAFVNEKLSENP